LEVVAAGAGGHVDLLRYARSSIYPGADRSAASGQVQSSGRGGKSAESQENGNNVFTLTGTQLNGLSEGASFGDYEEMASNYPIIRLTDANGNVSFARTFNWSSIGVATGSTASRTQIGSWVRSWWPNTDC
jgi:hypothetical protein